MDAELVDLITLSDPDMSPSELEQVVLTLRSSQLSSGAMVETFEQAFAAWLGRPHAVAVNSGTLGLVLVLRALEIGPGDEVITDCP